MTSEKLFHAIGYISDEIILEADSDTMTQPKALKPKWVRWLPAAACLAVVLVLAVTVPMMLNNATKPDHETTTQAMAEVYDNLEIYYVTDGNTIASENVYIRYAVADIFTKWAELNKVEGVALVGYSLNSNGFETIHENPDDPDNPSVEYTVGDHFTIDMTLSPEFAFYADGENGQFLIESLKTTFINFYAPLQIDEFNLVIGEQ